ncbi:MAG: hypothetical protein E6J33_10715 [Chloroflexi bacterium]|nr:MAG: hypothetical protein E6J33_10715 [Chloroflexota bacterium]
MNRIMNEKWPWIEAAHGMRSQLLNILSDADLAFSPGGQTMTLGALCRQMGETEHAYIQSLKTLKQEWSYHHPEADVASHVAQLKAWFQTLDDEMQATITTFWDEDGNKTIDRGGPVTVEFQLDVYLQAVLIFLGKATIYLRAMNKQLPPFFEEYIG